ncbi:Mevalonate kinase [Liberibacter crescens BT-1]|uniref:Mevalonate kinase n=2 Tax=Liberibacter crescens TaxID=1273132 RepID=L0EUS8_LIBCB|nr:Mevalonate kinase [Liberibacter crescens BT-1]
MGEHAVLHEQNALACAIDKKLFLSLKPRNDTTVTICSSLGNYMSDIKRLSPHPSFSFMITSIRHLNPPCGFDIQINSALDHTMGLGSSAAVTIAMTAALLALKSGKEPDKKDILKEAHAIVVATQGTGSGLDLAAALYGGLIAYRMQDYSVEPLPGLLPIHLVYSGYKTKTPEVIQKINQMKRQYAYMETLHKDIYSLIGKLSQIAIQAICLGHLEEVANAMNMQQGLLETLGVSDKTLSEIIWQLREQPEVMAAKISGSGLGDCILALGKVNTESLSYQSININMISEGMKLVLVSS